MSGLFVTFEGPEGSGKSTQIELLRSALAGRNPLIVREPGGTELGERIRDLLLHSEHRMSAEAELYLFMAARAELLATRIRPALAEGRMVIADRYHDSTLAYQGGGRGARTIWPPDFPVPDRTFLLALPSESGLERQRERGVADRLEQEPLQFHRAVAEAYDAMAREDPARWRRLDARLPPDELHRQVMESLQAFLEASRV